MDRAVGQRDVGELLGLLIRDDCVEAVRRTERHVGVCRGSESLWLRPLAVRQAPGPVVHPEIQQPVVAAAAVGRVVPGRREIERVTVERQLWPEVAAVLRSLERRRRPGGPVGRCRVPDIVRALGGDVGMEPRSSTVATAYEQPARPFTLAGFVHASGFFGDGDGVALAPGSTDTPAVTGVLGDSAGAALGRGDADDGCWPPQAANRSAAAIVTTGRRARNSSWRHSGPLVEPMSELRAAPSYRPSSGPRSDVARPDEVEERAIQGRDPKERRRDGWRPRE